VQSPIWKYNFAPLTVVSELTPRLPREPAVLPGLTEPVTVRPPTEPSPIRVAPEATEQAELFAEPLMTSVPALMVVAPL